MTVHFGGCNDGRANCLPIMVHIPAHRDHPFRSNVTADSGGA
jgi:hypothetical protein